MRSQLCSAEPVEVPLQTSIRQQRLAHNWNRLTRITGLMVLAFRFDHLAGWQPRASGPLAALTTLSSAQPGAYEAAPSLNNTQDVIASLDPALGAGYDMALVAQAGQCRARCVRQPARELDQHGEGCTLVAVKQFDDGGPLRWTHWLLLGLWLWLGLWRRSGGGVGVFINDADGGFACLGDEHATAALAIIAVGIARVGSVAFFDEAAFYELGNCLVRIGGRGRQGWRVRQQAAVGALCGGGQKDELGVGEFRHLSGPR